MPPRQIKSLSADVERTLSAAGTATAGSIVAGAREAQTTLVTASADAANQVKSLAADVERSLSIAGTSTANSIIAGAREAQTTLVDGLDGCRRARSRSLAADVQRSLSMAGTSTAETRSPPARARPRPRWSRLRRMPPSQRQVTGRRRRNVSLSMAGTSTAEAITTGAREAQTTLVTASSDAAEQVKSLAADVATFAVDRRNLHRRVDHRRRARGPDHAGHRLGGCRQPGQVAGRRHPALAVDGRHLHRRYRSPPAPAKPRPRSSAASSEAANHVKSLATDVERTLTAVGADTAASILNSAREAQSSLTATSADAASQIRAISADIERSLGAVTANTTDNIQTSALNAQSALVAASNEVSSKVKSTSADVERSVLAASSAFGSTMTGKTDEIVTYVQQQTDRLSQMIDGKRGIAGRGHRRQDQPAHARYRPRHLGCAEVDRDPRPGVLAVDDRPTAPTSRAPSPRPANWPPARSTSR